MVLIAKSKYRSLARIFPTNVVVMRLLCRAKLILTPNRRHMDRNTLEMLLYTWDPFTLDALTAAFMAERETRTSVRGEQRTAESERRNCAHAIEAAAEDSE